jgi:peptidoglycan endopeptidase LytE
VARARADAGAAAPQTHRVGRGQTLTQIARRYGTTVSQLMRANELVTSLIYVGQLLEIPAD